jgi:hypothetical protein
MAEIEDTMLRLEETAQLKDEPLVWQSYNDHPEPLVPFVDKALISHEVAPISLDDAFKRVIGLHRYLRTVDTALLGFIGGMLIGSILFAVIVMVRW